MMNPSKIRAEVVSYGVQWFPPVRMLVRPTTLRPKAIPAFVAAPAEMPIEMRWLKRLRTMSPTTCCKARSTSRAVAVSTAIVAGTGAPATRSG